MQELDLRPYLEAIKINLKIINRGSNDLLNYVDTNSWQRVLSTGNFLKLDLNSGILVSTQSIDKNKIYQLLGITEDTYNIWENYKYLFNDEQYNKITKYLRLRVPQYDSAFEALTQIIFGQQISVSVANKQRIKFIESIGKPYNDYLYKYPVANDLIKDKIEELNISENKKKSLLSIKEYFLLNKNLKEDIGILREELNKLFGIGPWTLDWLELRGLGNLNIIPVGDLQVKKVFCKFFNTKDYMNSKLLKKLENDLYPYGGLLTHYLLLFVN